MRICSLHIKTLLILISSVIIINISIKILYTYEGFIDNRLDIGNTRSHSIQNVSQDKVDRHSNDRNASYFNNIVDDQITLKPPRIIASSSSLISSNNKNPPINIIITSNIGPYGIINNPQQKYINYNHEIGDKTSTELNKMLSFMERNV